MEINCSYFWYVAAPFSINTLKCKYMIFGIFIAKELRDFPAYHVITTR